MPKKPPRPRPGSTRQRPLGLVLCLARERWDGVTGICRRCRGKCHVYELEDWTAVDSTPHQVESRCPRDEGRQIWVSLGTSDGLVRMNARNLKALLARLEVEKRRHLRRAVRADLRAARLREQVAQEGEEFRRVK